MNEDDTLQVSVTAIIVALVATAIPFGYLFAPVILGGFVPRYRTMLLATVGLTIWVVLWGTLEWVRHGESATPEHYILDRFMVVGPWYVGLAHFAYVLQCGVRLLRSPSASGQDDAEDMAPLDPAPVRSRSKAPASDWPAAGAQGALGEAAPRDAASHAPVASSHGFGGQGGFGAEARPVSPQPVSPQPVSSPPPGVERPAPGRPPDDGSGRGRPTGGGARVGKAVAVRVLVGGAVVGVMVLGVVFGVAVGGLDRLSLPDVRALLAGWTQPSPVAEAEIAALPQQTVGPPPSEPAGLCDRPDDHPFLVPEHSPYTLIRRAVDGVPFIWMSDRAGDVWWMEDFISGGQRGARISGPGGHDCGVYAGGFLSYGSRVYVYDGSRLESRDVICTVDRAAILCRPKAQP